MDKYLPQLSKELKNEKIRYCKTATALTFRNMKEIPVPNVDVYIAGFPPEVQKQLILLREAIRMSAPEAEEVISYQMPAYKLYACWCILQLTPNTSVFIPDHQELKISGRNSQTTKPQKERFSFLSAKHFQFH